MTESDKATKKINQLRQKFEARIREAGGNKDTDTVEIALQELLSIAEELEVTDEELRDQNDQLIAFQSELELERQRFQDIFQFAPNGYLVTDKKGIILEANQAAAAMLNDQPYLISGKPLYIFIHHDDRHSFLDRLAYLNGTRTPMQEQIHNWQIRLDQKDQKNLFVSIDAASIIGFNSIDNKENHTIRWILRDISRQKTLEKELANARRRLIFGLEQERQLIAREIHDVPIQDLMGALILNSTIANLDDREQQLAKMEELRQIITKSVRSLRSIIGQLRPPAISPFGLEKAIRSHTLDLENDHPEIQFHLELTQDKLSLPEEVRLNLFRIYQNSIMNVVRHSKAHNAIVRFDIRDGTAFLQVEDDGVGFNVPERLTTLVFEGHLGLANAAERAEVLGGEFQVTSHPGKGTIVQVKVPSTI